MRNGFLFLCLTRTLVPHRFVYFYTILNLWQQGNQLEARDPLPTVQLGENVPYP